MLSDHEGNSDENYKTDEASVRSSSPKSDSSASEISETSEASLCLEFSDTVSEDPQPDILTEEFDNLKLKEEMAEELTRQGADMRHVLCTSWKLNNKFVGKLLTNKSSKLSKSAPGQALRDMAQAQKLSIEEHEIAARMYGGYRMGSPANCGGFDDYYGMPAAAYSEEHTPILVSYADGSNSLTEIEQPVCMHNITVSCAVDSCHVFIQQMKNPTYEGLVPLEQAMYQTFQTETPPPLLLPIATGSLLAVFSDGKWYRCQVVSYDEEKDACDVKFVDHGGYTTVNVSELRPLREDFVRLPFQAIEVYIAHISPADDEIVIDIAADILFRGDVSLQLIGFAEDGVPVVQAYFYQGDYINLFTQEILEDCRNAFMKAHPDYTPSPITCTSAEASVRAESPSLECTSTEAGYSTDEGVWSPEPTEAETCSPEPTSPVQTVDCAVPATCGPEAAAWVPMTPMAPPVFVYYYGTDLSTGAVYYVTAPPLVPVTDYSGNALVSVPAYAAAPVPEAPSDYTEAHTELTKPVEEWSQEDYENYYSE